MPELPEVETVARCLRPHLVGRRLRGVRLRVKKLRRPLRAGEFQPLVGKKILAVRRRAKYLILEFSGSRALVVHLGMTGSLRLDPAGTPPRPHDHVELVLDRREILRYRDPRRFGLLQVARLDRPGGEPSILPRLGPEPLTAAFSGAYLFRISRRRQVPIKSLLLDQAVVAGVGNIYASEAGFRAGVRPTRRGATLTARECDRLARGVKMVLAAAIRAGGTTISDYVTPDGREGAFVRCLRVYGRAGATCGHCRRGVVRSVVIAGRSSFYCPVCQR